MDWRGSCEDCLFWKFHDDGTGHCKLNSVSCITSVMRHGKPRRFINRDDAIKQSENDDKLRLLMSADKVM